jgi:hypothetical protein
VSGPEFLTPRERQLLAAVRELVDLPEAAPGDQFGRGDELASRAAWLAGYLRDDDELTLEWHDAEKMIDRIRERAARQLRYKKGNRDVGTVLS